MWLRTMRLLLSPFQRTQRARVATIQSCWFVQTVNTKSNGPVAINRTSNGVLNPQTYAHSHDMREKKRDTLGLGPKYETLRRLVAGRGGKRGKVPQIISSLKLICINVQSFMVQQNVLPRYRTHVECTYCTYLRWTNFKQ